MNMTRYGIIYAIMFAWVLYIPLYACVVTFFNNGPGSVLIFDHNINGTGVPASLSFIKKGASRRIGKADEHAHFTVYIKPPKSNVFVSSYEIKQNECSKNGGPYIKLSDIQHNTGDAGLFTIIATHESHEPMVRQLPSIKRADVYKNDMVMSGCSACSK